MILSLGAVEKGRTSIQRILTVRATSYAYKLDYLQSLACVNHWNYSDYSTCINCDSWSTDSWETRSFRIWRSRYCWTHFHFLHGRWTPCDNGHDEGRVCQLLEPWRFSCFDLYHRTLYSWCDRWEFLCISSFKNLSSF